MITLEVNNISKNFDDFKAVQNLSFNLNAGKILGFLGPNGAGKTTTIRMIVGITAPDEGEIKIFGQTNLKEIRNRIGYLPEERGLYQKIEVEKQLKFFASLKNIRSGAAKESIDYWLSRMNLSQYKNKKAEELSKGTQQKIQFINTNLHDPDLLILDEPFSGLDPISTEELQTIIDEMKSKNKTIIFSTHQMETAERICDEVILINKSKKILGGSLRSVKESFESNIVSLRIKGGEKSLSNNKLVKEKRILSDEIQVHLTDNVAPKTLLESLMNENAEILKFEVTEPTLNDIFIQQVKTSYV